MLTMIKKISLRGAQIQTLLSEAKRTYPLEACSLLLGKIRGNTVEVTDVLCTQNIRKSPVRFEVDPEILYQVYSRAENEGKDFIGVFHSHPAPAIPSETDLKYMESNPYVVWVILSTLNHNLVAYQWQRGKACKIEIETLEEGS